MTNEQHDDRPLLTRNRRRTSDNRHRRHLTVAFVTILAVAATGGCSDDEPVSSGPTTPDPALTGAPVTAAAASTTNPEASSAQVIEASDIGSELAPGTYRSSTFSTPVSFTVPAGWKVFEDEPGQFGLAVVEHDGPPLLVVRDVGAAAEDCAESPQPGVGTSAAEIAEWLSQRDGVVATKPTPVTLGGLDGVEMEISMDPAWTGTCPFSDGQVTVPTIVSASALSSGFLWGLGPGDAENISLFDLPDEQGGGNLMVLLDTCCGITHAARLAEGEPIIDSFDFATGS